MKFVAVVLALLASTCYAQSIEINSGHSADYSIGARAYTSVWSGGTKLTDTPQNLREDIVNDPAGFKGTSLFTAGDDEAVSSDNEIHYTMTFVSFAHTEAGWNLGGTNPNMWLSYDCNTQGVGGANTSNSDFIYGHSGSGGVLRSSFDYEPLEEGDNTYSGTVMIYTDSNELEYTKETWLEFKIGTEVKITAVWSRTNQEWTISRYYDNVLDYQYTVDGEYGMLEYVTYSYEEDVAYESEVQLRVSPVTSPISDTSHLVLNHFATATQNGTYIEGNGNGSGAQTDSNTDMVGIIVWYPDNDVTQ